MMQPTKNQAALTTIASLAAASSAQAAIHVGGGVSLELTITPNGGFQSENAGWDIDGGGGETYFQVGGASSYSSYTTYSGGSGFFQSRSLFIAAYSSNANFGFLTVGSQIKTSNYYSYVSRPGSLKSVTNYSYVSGTGSFNSGLRLSERSSNFSFYSSSNLRPIASPMRVGFRFDRAGQTHYGVADLAYTFDPYREASLIISNVKWNDVADQGITGAGVAIPEPATAATGLGLLALGAAGLRRMRHTKKS